jgi:hypothetical protein
VSRYFDEIIEFQDDGEGYPVGLREFVESKFHGPPQLHEVQYFALYDIPPSLLTRIVHWFRLAGRPARRMGYGFIYLPLTQSPAPSPT